MCPLPSLQALPSPSNARASSASAPRPTRSSPSARPSSRGAGPTAGSGKKPHSIRRRRESYLLLAVSPMVTSKKFCRPICRSVLHGILDFSSAPNRLHRMTTQVQTRLLGAGPGTVPPPSPSVEPYGKRERRPARTRPHAHLFEAAAAAAAAPQAVFRGPLRGRRDAALRGAFLQVLLRINGPQ